MSAKLCRKQKKLNNPHKSTVHCLASSTLLKPQQQPTRLLQSHTHTHTEHMELSEEIKDELPLQIKAVKRLNKD